MIFIYDCFAETRLWLKSSEVAGHHASNPYRNYYSSFLIISAMHDENFYKKKKNFSNKSFVILLLFLNVIRHLPTFIAFYNPLIHFFNLRLEERKIFLKRVTLPHLPKAVISLLTVADNLATYFRQIKLH
jgi:hypothetical protein